MYKFVDVIDVPSDSSLPAEALKINGQWIEEVIPGYRTLYVSGRELLNSEVKDQEIGITDGAQYVGKRYPARTITVTYQLVAKSDSAFREAYNKLNGLLDKEQVELIFNDEPDKYFIGTKTSNSEVSGGTNHVTGEIGFYCPDPFKYSVAKKTFQATQNDDGIMEATIVNESTCSVPVSYEIIHNHENGYIGIVSEQGVMQYGKIDEVDGETYQGNEMLTNSSDSKEWSCDSNWVDDTGVNGMSAANKTAGTFKVVTVYENDKFIDIADTGNKVLALESPGTTDSGWNGAMKTFEVVDSNGNTGARDFYAYMNSWFQTSRPGQTGAQTIAFLDENNKMICSQSIFKWDMSGNTAYVNFTVGGDNPRTVKQVKFTPSSQDSQNPYNYGRGHSDMRKEGDTITFYWWGSYPSFIVPELEDVKVAKVQIYIAQYGSRNMSTQYVTRNYFRRISLQAMNVDKWRNVPNRYQEGDILLVDGETSKFYVNGMPRLGDEITGTKYFKVPPGETKVQFYCSDFCDPVPDITASIKEAYL